MKENKTYKEEALSALRGNWGPSVLATLALMIILLVFMLPYQLKMQAAAQDPTNLALAQGSMKWWVFYLLGALLVINPLYVGLVNAFKLLLTAGDDGIASNGFKIGFGNWLHHVWGYFLRDLFVFLWTLLLVVPGIIKGLSYAMTGYILVEHPELSANKAIDLSKEMMYGHKYDLFYLYISFIGWFLLSAFSLCIGLLWLIPYVQSAQASFYLDVKADWEARRSAAQGGAPDTLSRPLDRAEPVPERPVAPPINEVARKEENPEDYMPK